jgi:signal transduction histidine kinase
LKDLTTHVDRLGSIAGGGGSANPAAGVGDEVRHLGLAFNAMSEKLQNSYANMELKVEERTRMLKEANEQLLEKSDELQRINLTMSDTDRSRSELLATISGELRQPLRSIMAFSKAMIEENFDYDSQAQYLGDIHRNAQNLDDQIADLLAMSKIEAGLMGLDYLDFRIDDVIDEIKTSMIPLVERKSLKFSVDIAPETPVMVADYNKIKHVLRNLLSNSLKYTPEGGWIRVRVEPIPVSRDSQEMVLIQVIDSGVGIKSGDLPNIFTKMWQDKKPGDSEESGGLGLAIVKIFIELHGGTVDVKSVWQKGTLFSIRIPSNADEM